MRATLLAAGALAGLVLIPFFLLLWQLSAVLFIFAGAVFTWRTFRPCKIAAPSRWPSVTIVVAMRNEEQNVLHALHSLAGIIYSPLEIIIVNDRSTDNTARMAQEWLETYPGAHTITLLHTPEDPPTGLNGKSFATDYGIRQATGSIILSCDADVTHSPGSLQHTVSHLVSKRASILSRPPHLVIKGAGEYPFLLHVLILRFSSWIAGTLGSRQSFAMGTYLMFTKEFYERSGGWNRHRGYPESLPLLNYALENGDTFVFLDEGSAEITARFYNGARETAFGMLRNMNVPLLQPLPFAISFLLIGANCGAALYGFTEILRTGTPPGALLLPALLSLFFCIHLVASKYPLKTSVYASVLTPLLLWVNACLGILALLRIVFPYKLRWRGRPMGIQSGTN